MNTEHLWREQRRMRARDNTGENGKNNRPEAAGAGGDVTNGFKSWSSIVPLWHQDDICRRERDGDYCEQDNEWDGWWTPGRRRLVTGCWLLLRWMRIVTRRRKTGASTCEHCVAVCRDVITQSIVQAVTSSPSSASSDQQLGFVTVVITVVVLLSLLLLLLCCCYLLLVTMIPAYYLTWTHTNRCPARMEPGSRGIT